MDDFFFWLQQNFDDLILQLNEWLEKHVLISLI